jgi:hypothetical protein
MTTIRAHLTSKHGPVYHKVLEQNELRSRRFLNQLYDDNDEFDLDTWLDLLADCVVVNDQVCCLLAKLH